MYYLSTMIQTKTTQTMKNQLKAQIEELTNQAVYTRLIKSGSLKGFAQFESKAGKFTA